MEGGEADGNLIHAPRGERLHTVAAPPQRHISIHAPRGERLFFCRSLGIPFQPRPAWERLQQVLHHNLTFCISIHAPA